MTAQLDLKSGEEQDLFQKIREHPEQLSAYRRLARVLAKRDNCDGAVAVLKQAARRDPGDRETRVLLAHVYENAGRLPEAARVLRALIKRGAVRFLPYERLARVYKKQGRRTAVAPLLEAVPGGSPLRERALKKLVEIYKEEGKWRPALDAAERLIAEFGPEFGRVKDRARLLDRLDRPREAIAFYRQAARLSPENPDVPFLLGLCQKRSGDRTGARETFLGLTGIRHGYYGGNMQLAEMDIEDGDLEAAEERL
nr:tetratricopeptide repeat protein [bacterium]